MITAKQKKELFYEPTVEKAQEITLTQKMKGKWAPRNELDLVEIQAEGLAYARSSSKINFTTKLWRLINQSRSKDDSRPTLTMLESDGHSIVSTNGHSLTILYMETKPGVYHVNVATKTAWRDDSENAPRYPDWKAIVPTDKDVELNFVPLQYVDDTLVPYSRGSSDAIAGNVYQTGSLINKELLPKGGDYTIFGNPNGRHLPHVAYGNTEGDKWKMVIMPLMGTRENIKAEDIPEGYWVGLEMPDKEPVKLLKSHGNNVFSMLGVEEPPVFSFDKAAMLCMTSEQACEYEG